MDLEMKIGVLEAGAPPAGLAQRFGTYSNMFRRLFGPAFSFKVFDPQAADYPTSADGCDAYLITGSSAAVYEEAAWIGRLEAFVRETIGSAPMLGVCFGHQLMAKALGGEVVKSPNGWGLGLHRYEVQTRAPWMDSSPSFALPVSHQDQVTALGPDARVLGGSAFTPFGLIDYPALRAMSIQAHPEFEPDFAKALIEQRRGAPLDTEAADSAIDALSAPNDRRRVEVWMRRFLNTA
jgi:GMP synthase-like glutamine amidotransferase